MGSMYDKDSNCTTKQYANLRNMLRYTTKYQVLQVHTITQHLDSVTKSGLYRTPRHTGCTVVRKFDVSSADSQCDPS